MIILKNLIKIFPFLLIFNLVVPDIAYAYLDPGIGSYIFQILMAFILAAFFSIKLFWKKIVSNFKKIFRKK